MRGREAAAARGATDPRKREQCPAGAKAKKCDESQPAFSRLQWCIDAITGQRKKSESRATLWRIVNKYVGGLLAAQRGVELLAKKCNTELQSIIF